DIELPEDDAEGGRRSQAAKSAGRDGGPTRHSGQSGGTHDGDRPETRSVQADQRPPSRGDDFARAEGEDHLGIARLPQQVAAICGLAETSADFSFSMARLSIWRTRSLEMPSSAPSASRVAPSSVRRRARMIFFSRSFSFVRAP